MWFRPSKIGDINIRKGPTKMAGADNTRLRRGTAAVATRTVGTRESRKNKRQQRANKNGGATKKRTAGNPRKKRRQQKDADDDRPLNDGT